MQWMFSKPNLWYPLLTCRTHVLPRLGKLPEAVRDEAMLATVHALPRLSASVAEVIRQAPFVATAAGALRAPCQLYDPRCTFLRAPSSLSGSCMQVHHVHHVISGG